MSRSTEDSGETASDVWDTPYCSSMSPYRSGTYEAKRLPFTALLNRTADGTPCHLKAAFVLTAGPSLDVAQRTSLQPHCKAGSLHSHRMDHKVLDFPHETICSHTLRTRQGLKPAALAGFGRQKIQMLPLQAEGPLHSPPLFHDPPPTSFCCFCF